MAVWTKDTASQSPKTVYTAPAGSPFVQVVYDPNAEHKWTVVYSYLQTPDDTQASIEALIGL